MEAIQIIPFENSLRTHFEIINKAWVEELFAIEPFDKEQLEQPEKTILEKGGAIIFAKKGEEIVGTVGLSKIDEQTYELIKMGVSKNAQGLGIGKKLGIAILEKAKEMGARKVVLYTHTKLQAALKIYQNLGFQEVPVRDGKYCRCDLMMEVQL
ncbi:Ribosomal protein S18 acetylase RimI [Algoriphagus ornithinivorans]|uniref:Ribosomal protein S18 acetylase RimI n=1 Tax=Algoriphagus ornithinivorans TaxID=226506 RepID=A0A1I5H454_9BACT|nr:GNAT family N-acetyltransferase [Algoriphagus ornithinivorans]SFO43068.1 Ribosomal protein S18 acetylase RimI [Algoriphagus ornithinivorans]